MNCSVRARRGGALLAAALGASSVLAFVAGAPPAGAAQGGPDPFGYAFIDSNEVGGPTFSYTEISGTGTQLIANSDDQSAAVATPFPITIYGESLNSLGVSTNGVISTPAGINSDFSNNCLPTSEFNAPTLFVHWDDLFTAVHTQTVGVAPNRQFIVEWSGGYFSGGGVVEFQAVFSENTPNFQYRYQTVGQGGSSGTVGAQAAGGSASTSFLQYSCNQVSSVTGGRAIDWNFVGPQTTAPRVTVTASTPDAVEGGAPGAFTFTRTGDRFNSLNAVYSVSGTATSGEDFEPLSGTVNFPFGAATVTVPVTALTDSADEEPETVTATVEFGEYDRPEPRSATVTILDAVADPCEASAGETPFSDVPSTNEHADSVACVADLGIAQGYPDGRFKPSDETSRAQMASFVARTLDAAGVELPASPPDAYPGDDAGVPHEKAIDQLAALNVLDDTTGQVGDEYDVSGDMRRDDMAQFLVNAYEVITGEALPAGPNAFGDDDSSDNEDAINALAAAGVVEGTGGGNYNPGGTVSRGQMASFLARFAGLLADQGVELTPLA